jgi:hypothetical protein
MNYTDAHLALQKRATRALLKFSEDHANSATGRLVEIRRCLASLEAGDVATAHRHFKAVPFGGMGRFDDWLPPVVFPHEDPEYVWGLFEALCVNWTFAMNLGSRD